MTKKSLQGIVKWLVFLTAFPKTKEFPASVDLTGENAFPASCKLFYRRWGWRKQMSIYLSVQVRTAMFFWLIFGQKVIKILLFWSVQQLKQQVFLRSKWCYLPSYCIVVWQVTTAVWTVQKWIRMIIHDLNVLVFVVCLSGSVEYTLAT